MTNVTVSRCGRYVAFIGLRGVPGGGSERPAALQAFYDRVGIHLGVYPPALDTRLCLVDLAEGVTAETRYQVFPGLRGLAWASDGSRLVFVSGELDLSDPVTQHLLSFDVHAGSATEIASSGSLMKGPQFSPCGRYVGYVHGYPRRSLSIVDPESADSEIVCNDMFTWIHWCWSTDGARVYYFRRNGKLCEKSLETGVETEIHTCKQNTVKAIGIPLCSPDGQWVGFQYAGVFHTVAVETGELTRWFECDFLDLEFDWSDCGVCYIEQADKEIPESRRLVVNPLDGTPGRVVATGPIAFARWLGRDRILVRYGPAELRIYDVTTGQSRTCYP